MLLLPAVLHADPLAEVAAFSALKIDRAKLDKGGIVSMPSSGMAGVPRGQCIESLFVVAAPAEKTIESLKEWNGTVHPELKVYLHGDLSSAPSPGEFKKLGSAPNNESVRAFVAATEKLSANPAELQMNSAEAKDAPTKTARGAGIPPEMVNFWGNLLEKRARAFQGGGVPAQPPYAVSGQKVAAAEEIAELLKAQPKIQSQFRAILAGTGLGGKPSAKPSLYWELLDGEGTAMVSLGASFSSSTGKGGQAVDLQYYATGSYYALLTLHQVWPIELGATPASLVWRVDLLSSSSLANVKGIERKAAARALSIELERVIGCFQKDTAAH